MDFVLDEAKIGELILRAITRQYGSSKAVTYRKTLLDGSIDISMAFSWRNSAEGYTFWKVIYRLYPSRRDAQRLVRKYLAGNDRNFIDLSYF